ncbi:hypothetical protein APY03_2678 [Variovorax sp. WDL1]|nr:hypothetical protein APY03_2678 [Variovorax sp. WDL1]
MGHSGLVSCSRDVHAQTMAQACGRSSRGAPAPVNWPRPTRSVRAPH